MILFIFSLLDKTKTTSKNCEIIAGVVSAVIVLILVLAIIVYIRRWRGRGATPHRDDAEGSHRQSVDSLSGIFNSVSIGSLGNFSEYGSCCGENLVNV